MTGGRGAMIHRINRSGVNSILIIILLCCSVSLTACRKTEQMDSLSTAEAVALEGGEHVTLDFYIWSDEQPYMTKVVEAFNDMQNETEIRLRVITSSEYEDAVDQALDHGGAVDLIDLRNNAIITDYAKQGTILDLTEYLRNSSLDISKYGSLWDYSKIGDRSYVLPTRRTSWALFYNADMFREAGLSEPGQLTWDEYAELALQLQKRLQIPYGGYWVKWNLPLIATQNSWYCNSDDLEELRLAMAFMNRIYNEDQSHISPEEQEWDNADYTQLFENGAFAMMPNGEWAASALLEDEKKGNCKINWKVTSLPVLEGMEENTTIGGFQYVGISSTCCYPERAFSFLEFLCGKEGAEILTGCGMIPAYLTKEVQNTYLREIGKEGTDQFFSNRIIMTQPMGIPHYSEISNCQDEIILEYLNGQKSLDEALQKFETERMQIVGNIEGGAQSTTD